MKHIAIEANGYTFDVAIDEYSPLGEIALAVPANDLIALLTKTATDVNLNPDNIEEMNLGGHQVIYSLA